MMNKKELHAAFSAVHASEDLVKEVLSVEVENKKAVNGWVITRRAVACAAVLALLLTLLFWPGETKTEDGEIIEAPGILKVYACDLEMVATENLEEYEWTENTFRWRGVWGVTISDSGDIPSFGRPITFLMPENYYGAAEVTFCVSSELEGFCEETELANGEVFYLTKQLDFLTKLRILEENADKDVYLDIIIYADEKIAGYGVMSFYMNGYNGCCYAYKCATVCFPMVDGEVQDVSEEYVWQQIKEYKQAQPEGQGAEFFQQAP